MQIRQTTKELIAASFMELANTKPIDKITVREVAANCGITTVTFYNHFRDKYELLIWIYVNQAVNIMKKTNADGYSWRDTLYDVIHFFSENRKFLLNALRHTSGHDSFSSHMEQINIDIITGEVKKSLGSRPLTTELDYDIRIFCYGTIRLVFDWLTSEKPIPPDEIAQIMEKSLPPLLAPHLSV
jgi:probable dihydroxyacetone kinase regulator